MKIPSSKKVFQACKVWSARVTIASMIAIVLVCGINPANAGALTKEQQTLFEKFYILRFDWKEDAVCGSGGVADTGGGTVGGGGPGIWNSGLQPPYIVEQYAIESLKAIAQKRGVPQSATVTEQHVQGVVAFILGEGGDINNTSSIFNLLNTGLNAPELLDGPARGDGVQAFKSFDAGVEATARTMVGSFQDRMADTLINPATTAEQFLEAVSYWFKYEGNHPWAEASRGREAAYYQERLNLLAQVRARYADIAGLVIGTQALEQQLRITEKSKLVYAGGGSTTPSTSSPEAATAAQSCQGGNVVAGCNPPGAGTTPRQLLVSTALCLAWDTKGGHVILPNQMIELGCGDYCDGGAKQSKPNYVTAQQTFNKYTNINPFSDCGIFTATVIHASGVDSSYTKRLTTAQRDYALRNPDKWKAIPNVTSTLQLKEKEGTILISDGHTYIYTGVYSSKTNGQQYNSAQASLSWTTPGHAPEATNFWTEAGYTGFEFIGTPTGTASPVIGGNNGAI